MSKVGHTTYGITATGHIDRLTGSLPAVVANSLPPVRVTVTDGLDAHEAARLLRLVADEIERGEGEP